MKYGSTCTNNANTTNVHVCNGTALRRYSFVKVRAPLCVASAMGTRERMLLGSYGVDCGCKRARSNNNNMVMDSDRYGLAFSNYHVGGGCF